jgi:hypothetical protein
MKQIYFTVFLSLLVISILPLNRLCANLPGTLEIKQPSEIFAGENDAESTYFSQPAFAIEVGAESFFHHDFRSNETLGGLAAIMIDMDARISQRFSFFGAFHFDTSPWYDFMNQPFIERQDAYFAYDIDLHVEEFYLTWAVVPERFELSAGRRFSMISYANQLHLADFQFNTKPRIFTEYWGDNHGMALDGIGLKWTVGHDNFSTSFLFEAAKNGYSADHTIAIGIVDARLELSALELGIRGFTYFDHQTENHPLFHYVPGQTEWFLMDDGFSMNATGGGLNAYLPLNNNRSLLFQSEILNRKMAADNYFGMYGFLIFNYSTSIAGSVMYQQLDIPLLTEGFSDRTREHSVTLGVSYFPAPDHRVRIEYGHFSNSNFYRSMLLAKWTFCVSIMD